ATDRGGLFEAVEQLPNDVARRRYERLVGLDDVKARLGKEARLLFDPALLDRWSNEHHGKVINATGAFRERVPLFIFAGDVGTGKTALAETFGDAVARATSIEVLLMRLSLRTRGTGSVGEMTQLIASAFDHVQSDIPIPRGSASP